MIYNLRYYYYSCVIIINPDLSYFVMFRSFVFHSLSTYSQKMENSEKQCQLTIDIFQGKNSAIFKFAFLINGNELLKKRICSHRSKFFPLRVDPILEVFFIPKSKQKSKKKLLPFIYLMGYSYIFLRRVITWIMITTIYEPAYVMPTNTATMAQKTNWTSIVLIPVPVWR